jgi:predicted deacylase
MKTEIHRLRCSPPGTIHELRVLRFGTPGARPKATIQAALHADETPALLVAQALRDLLQQLEDSGALLGEVVLVPAANPVGLGQHLLGRHEGRFDLRDGINFNRGHANLADRAQLLLQGRLGSEPAVADPRRGSQAHLAAPGDRQRRGAGSALRLAGRGAPVRPAAA